MLTSRDFNIWAAKAPVNDARAQLIALSLYREVRPLLTAGEFRDVEEALERADNDEGRTEFDLVALRIRDRLFGDRKGKQTKPEAWRGL